MKNKKNKKNKKNIIRSLVGFLIFMFSCTIVSRGIYTSQMPQIKPGIAQARTITHQVEVQGRLVKKSSHSIQSEKAVVTVPGLQVDEVDVKTGDKIKAGTVLFKINKEKLQEQLKEWEKQETDASEKISQLYQRKKTSDAGQAQNRENLKQQAEDEVEDVKREQNQLVEEAKKEYEKAEADFKKYPTWEEYLKEQIQGSLEYLTMQKEATKKGATQEDKDAFQLFASTFEAAAEKTWEQEKRALENTTKQANDKWQRAKKTRFYEVEKIEKTKQRELQQDDTEEMNLEAEVKEQQRILQKAQEEEEKYQAILRADGVVTSDFAGTIQSVNVSVGDSTPESAAVVLSDVKWSWKFIAELSEEEKQYVKPGDTVDLSFPDENIEWKQMEVSEITKNEEGGYQAVIIMNKKNLKEMDGVMQMNADSNTKECCVPLSALYASGKENYVLVIRENNTFLGTEYTAEKRKVSLEDKNGEYAALKDNPLSNEERIVVLSDREVTPGQNIRMMEEESENE